ncbi:MAG: hypothetical protein WBV73_00105 [Phormidium sp.]
MTQQPKNNPIVQDTTSSKITRKEPELPPTLIESWIVWEFAAVIQTTGIIFDTGALHDLLKQEMVAQKVPIDICYSDKAGWIIEGLVGSKIDLDLRPRVVATLGGKSLHKNMKFIAGIDYFGTKWADIQMMMIVQPEKMEYPDQPERPFLINTKPLIPNEALAILGAIGLCLIVLTGGNSGLILLGIIAIMAAGILWFQSNQKVFEAISKNEQNQRQYENKYAAWQREIKKIEQAQEELIRNRLSRSFQWDDLRVLHKVMTLSVIKIIQENLIKQGAKVETSVESTKNEEIIPESKKNMFDEF